MQKKYAKFCDKINVISYYMTYRTQSSFNKYFHRIILEYEEKNKHN